MKIPVVIFEFLYFHIKVLDSVIEVFNNKGNEDLGVPPPPSECLPAPNIEPTMTRQEKYKLQKQRLAVKRKKAEMYSLWCDALYRFSLANHVRNRNVTPVNIICMIAYETMFT